MLYTALLVAASAAIASAQLSYNSTTGKFVCPADKPNGDFCASESLSTNIIIRCTNGIGQPGNCNDNLAGYFPFGVNYAPCWQTSNTTGDAACSKNCIVQCGSGACGTPPGSGTISLPNCTPTPTPSSSSSSVSSTPTPTPTPSSSSSSYGSSSSSSSSTTTSTGTTTYTTGSTTVTSTFTTTYCPSSMAIIPTGGSTSHPSNGTTTTKTCTSCSATKSPSGPSTTPTQVTGGASSFAPGALAGVGLIMAYFL